MPPSHWLGHKAAISSTAWCSVCKTAIYNPGTMTSRSVVRAHLPMKKTELSSVVELIMSIAKLPA